MRYYIDTDLVLYIIDYNWTLQINPWFFPAPKYRLNKLLRLAKRDTELIELITKLQKEATHGKTTDKA